MTWKEVIKQRDRHQEIEALVKQTKQELLKAIDDAVKDSPYPDEETIYRAISEYASSMTHGWN